MVDDIKSYKTLKDALSSQFSFTNKISEILLNNVPISPSANATVFFDSNNNLFIYVYTNSKLNLADIRGAISKMGLRPLVYLPPKGDPDYFDSAARQKYQRVFPSRKSISDNDLEYYRTLVPYAPALVQISEIKDGAIKTYSPDTHGSWRVVIKQTYKK